MIGHVIMWALLALGAIVALAGGVVMHADWAVILAGIALMLLGFVFAYWEDRIQKRDRDGSQQRGRRQP